MSRDSDRRPRHEDKPAPYREDSPVAVNPDKRPADLPKNVQFGRLAAVTTGYTLLVVLFGAYNRASLSGRGCGESWPDCQGTFSPGSIIAGGDFHRLVEFTHRASFVPMMLMLVALAYLARMWFPKGSPVRRATNYVVGITVAEAVVGAALVKFGWVESDKSAQRAVVMAIHLVMNYLLTGNLVMLTYFAFTGRGVEWRGQGVVATALKANIAGMVVLGCTGALSAMGKTAFALELAGARTLSERIAAHVGEAAHPLLRGGMLHPVVATSIGLLMVWMCGLVVHHRPTREVKALSKWVVFLYLAQFAFGVVNLLASAPAGMQIVHLALAIADWLALSLLCAVALRPEEAVPSVEPERAPASVREVLGAYVAVTKPRVISLLLFTTYAAMFVAQGGWPPLGLTLAVMVGGYMSAGAANAFNMLVERDLDVAMERTSRRPTLTGVLSLRQIHNFAWALTIGSVALLWSTANFLTAAMALCGLLTYVFVYTLWLKRRTWQNIVIGGAAGAFPPLVGYAAVSNQLTPYAWFLFALIFTWTPVHFWALAMLIKEDYAAAKVPMLPVVKGDKVTAVQIMVYAVLTALLCVVPFVQREAGWIYMAGSGLLNLGLVAQSFRLLKKAEKPQARALFKFSMAYLALIFVVIAADKAVGPSFGGSRAAAPPVHMPTSRGSA